MALFDNAFLQKAKEKATSLSNKAVDSVKNSISQTQGMIDQKKEQFRLSRLPQEGGLKRYEVNYKGGLPGYPREKEVSRNPQIYLDIMPDRFSFVPKPKSAVWFAGVDIPYTQVISLDIVERTVNTAETLVSIGLENLDFHQKNILELTFLGNDQEEYVLRCEMVTGLTTMGEARVCLELIDLLRANKLMKLFIGRNEPAALPQAQNTDVIQQLRGFKELLDAGVITQEEFDIKKKQLLGL